MVRVSRRSKGPGKEARVLRLPGSTQEGREEAGGGKKATGGRMRSGGKGEGRRKENRAEEGAADGREPEATKGRREMGRGGEEGEGTNLAQLGHDSEAITIAQQHTRDERSASLRRCESIFRIFPKPSPSTGKKTRMSQLLVPC